LVVKFVSELELKFASVILGEIGWEKTGGEGVVELFKSISGEEEDGERTGRDDDDFCNLELGKDEGDSVENLISAFITSFLSLASFSFSEDRESLLRFSETFFCLIVLILSISFSRKVLFSPFKNIKLSFISKLKVTVFILSITLKKYQKKKKKKTLNKKKNVK
jgi:hypothetical protein